VKVEERRAIKVTLNRPHRRTGFLVVVAMLDDLVVVGLIFLAFWVFHVRLTAWAIAAIGLVLGSFVFIVHHALVPSLRLRTVTGAEGMIGQEAVVADALDPDGTVLVEGERWRARSLDGDIASGESVEIVSVERLSLEVRRL
jgi:membrane-bound ClpP family serine protease